MTTLHLPTGECIARSTTVEAGVAALRLLSGEAGGEPFRSLVIGADEDVSWWVPLTMDGHTGDETPWTLDPLLRDYCLPRWP